jgi:hypothetical protein
MRRARIIERLQGLADDALLEGCEMAALLMRDTAAALQSVIFDNAASPEAKGPTSSKIRPDEEEG